jgi:hypothetical protein
MDRKARNPAAPAVLIPARIPVNPDLKERFLEDIIQVVGVSSKAWTILEEALDLVKWEVATLTSALMLIFSPSHGPTLPEGGGERKRHDGGTS